MQTSILTKIEDVPIEGNKNQYHFFFQDFVKAMVSIDTAITLLLHYILAQYILSL